MDISTIGSTLQIIATIGGFLLGLAFCALALGGYKARFESVEKAVKEKLPKEISKMGDEIHSLDKTMCSIRSALLQTKVLDSAFLKTESPIKITPQGKKALKESGFIDIFSEHKTKILDRIKHKNLQTDYDVQQYAINVVFVLSDEPFMEPLKKYAYQKGEPLSELLYIAGIYVRDEYLKSKFNKKD